jgi:hypothetical protein
VQTHTTGTRDNTTPVVKGTQSTTWASTRDTGTMSLLTVGLGYRCHDQAGRRVHISSVFAVNP